MKSSCIMTNKSLNILSEVLLLLWIGMFQLKPVALLPKLWGCSRPTYVAEICDVITFCPLTARLERRRYQILVLESYVFDNPLQVSLLHRCLTSGWNWLYCRYPRQMRKELRYRAWNYHACRHFFRWNWDGKIAVNLWIFSRLVCLSMSVSGNFTVMEQDTYR